MKTTGFTLALSAALFACAHQQDGTAQAPIATYPSSSGSTSCSFDRLSGIHANATDARDGVTITFTGPPGELSQLRDAVRAMSDSSDRSGNPFAECSCGRRATEAALGSAESMPTGHEDALGPTDYPPRGADRVPRPDATFEEIGTGAVLTLTVKDKAQLEPLRAEAREYVSQLQTGCTRH
jgi:hypothetical protein